MHDALNSPHLKHQTPNIKDQLPDRWTKVTGNMSTTATLLAYTSPSTHLRSPIPSALGPPLTFSTRPTHPSPLRSSTTCVPIRLKQSYVSPSNPFSFSHQPIFSPGRCGGIRRKVHFSPTTSTNNTTTITASSPHIRLNAYTTLHTPFLEKTEVEAPWNTVMTIIFFSCFFILVSSLAGVGYEKPIRINPGVMDEGGKVGMEKPKPAVGYSMTTVMPVDWAEVNMELSGLVPGRGESDRRARELAEYQGSLEGIWDAERVLRW